MHTRNLTRKRSDYVANVGKLNNVMTLSESASPAKFLRRSCDRGESGNYRYLPPYGWLLRLSTFYISNPSVDFYTIHFLDIKLPICALCTPNGADIGDCG